VGLLGCVLLATASAASAQVRVVPIQVIVGRIGDLVPVLFYSVDGAGFVAADQPENPLYTPALGYQWNSTGADNIVLRTGVGEYFVKLPGLGGNGGTVQVSAYGAGPARCKVTNWLGLRALLAINVRCFRGNEQVDAPFIASFERISKPTDDVSYGLNTHTNFQQFSWSAEPAYALNYREFYRAGDFETALPDQDGLMHVTAFGPNSEHCIVNTLDGIACFDADGKKVRADYVVGVHNNSVANAGKLGAWVSFDAAFPASASYPFFPNRQWGTPVSIRVDRLSRGSYRVSLPGMPASDKAVPLVTGYDIETGDATKSVHCKPFAWYPSEGETLVDVHCYGVGGDDNDQPVDAQFNLSYLTNR
jgi:hypothetical protein